MAADLVTIATTAVLTQFLAPAAKNLGEVALEQARQIGKRAVGYLAAVGREPHPVEPKILLPLVQAASLETDEALVERWAALLANAADPAQRIAVQPSFVDILRQLTLHDAAILDHLQHAPRRLAADTVINKFVLTTALLHAAIGTNTLSKASLDNLMRLRLCIGFPMIPERVVGTDFDLKHRVSVSDYDLLSGDKYIALTDLGLAFLAAATPPML